MIKRLKDIKWSIKLYLCNFLPKLITYLSSILSAPFWDQPRSSSFHFGIKLDHHLAWVENPYH